jgi:hypothetical protein
MRILLKQLAAMADSSLIVSGTAAPRTFVVRSTDRDFLDRKVTH